MKATVNQIEQLCIARGVRLTPQRRKVYELICQSPKASSAYELLDALRETESSAKPPTVYRALDFLMEQGFIHRVESTNSYVSCSHGHDKKHFSHLLICDQCGNVVELQDSNLIALLQSNAQQHGFDIQNHVIESHGTCSSCKKQQ
ncbi:zinc uptake transcriptional repressor Zur [Vibrio sp. WXL103]|uniref:zinc uptake transcriptional repressor Zur n=1 Tax=unclassified Vibrio TaxID=2614977 RepID=UPI003EC5AAAE